MWGLTTSGMYDFGCNLPNINQNAGNIFNVTGPVFGMDTNPGFGGCINPFSNPFGGNAFGSNMCAPQIGCTPMGVPNIYGGGNIFGPSYPMYSGMDIYGGSPWMGNPNINQNAGIINNRFEAADPWDAMAANLVGNLANNLMYNMFYGNRY